MNAFWLAGSFFIVISLTVGSAIAALNDLPSDELTYPLWLQVLQDFQAVLAGILAIFAAWLTANAIKSAAIHNSESNHKALRHQIQETYDSEAIKFEKQTLLQRIELAGAFEGEIGSIRTLIETRDIVGSYRNDADRLEAIKDAINAIPKLANEPGLGRYPIEEDYFTVWKEGCSRIGVFRGDLPRDVSTFYTLATGAKDFLGAIYRGFYDNEPAVHQAKTARIIADDFERLVYMGKALELKLNAEAQDALVKIHSLDRREVTLPKPHPPPR